MKNYFAILLVFGLGIAFSQQITGVVVDQSGIGLDEVLVELEGTDVSTLTNEEGSFTLESKDGTNIILSKIGFRTKHVSTSGDLGQIVLFEGIELLDVTVEGKRQNKFSRKATAYVGKMPLKDIENTQVYSTVPSELLESQIVTNLDEAMTNATGVYKLWESTGRDPGQGTSFYTMRGFSVQPQIVDGISGITLSAVDPSYIERVEVVKGPTATLFGSTETSLGGLINIVTKKPFKGKGGSASYTAGSFGLHRGSLDYNTPLGKKDNIFFRINASYLTQNSFQDAGFKKTFFIAPSLTFKLNERLNISTAFEYSRTKQTNPSMLFLRRGFPLLNSSVEEMGVDPNKSFTSDDIYLTNPVFNTRLVGDYKISDNWTSQTVFSGTIAETKGDYQYQFDGGIGGVLSLSQFSQPLNDNIAAAEGGIAQLEAIGASDPNSPYHQQYLEAQGLLSVLNSTNNSLNTILGDASNLFSQNAFTRVFSRRDADAKRFNVQQNFIGDFKIGKARNRMVVGLDYLNKTQTNRNKFMYPGVLNLSEIQPFLAGLRTLGLGDQADLVEATFGQFPYFDAFLNPQGELIATGFAPNATTSPSKADLDAVFNGQTATAIKTKSQVMSAYISNVVNVLPNLTLNIGLRLDHFKQDGDTRFSSDDYTKTTFSPSAGILYQPIKDKVSLFANYQTGYRDNNPEINQNQDVVVSVFNPTKANQFETGVKTSLLRGKLNLGASYYNIKIKDFVTGDPNALIFPRSIDIAEAVSQGFEFEVNANPISGLNLRASFSTNSMKYTDVNSKLAIVPGQVDADGNQLYGRELTEYADRRPISAGPENLYNFWADYQFQEGSFAKGFGLGAGFNGASEQLAVNNAVSGTFSLPSYTLFNASLYYNANNFRVGVKVNNLTDKEYYTGWSTINAQAPRAFLGTISYKF